MSGCLCPRSAFNIKIDICVDEKLFKTLIIFKTMKYPSNNSNVNNI